jgi:hypothetical protein
MDTSNAPARPPWDAYEVWQILLHRHPVKIEDPSGSCGHIDRETLAGFCEGVSDYPDFLQDTLFIIAHAEGLAGAVRALDDAVRAHLSGARSTRDTPSGAESPS